MIYQSLMTCLKFCAEILEFDASEDLPSVLDVELFDFDGPFDQAASLGHTEINFLKHSATELADMWVPLQGKKAVSCQAKLHLRIFVENKKGVETIKEYLNKMEREVGKKVRNTEYYVYLIRLSVEIFSLKGRLIEYIPYSKTSTISIKES